MAYENNILANKLILEFSTRGNQKVLSLPQKMQARWIYTALFFLT